MTTTLFIHTGLGDAIVLAGAAICLAKKHGSIRFPCYKRNMPSVRSMFQNNHEVEVFELPLLCNFRNVFVPYSSKEGHCIMVEDSPQHPFDVDGDILRCGFFSTNEAPFGMSFPEWFYDQLGVPFNERWDSCPVKEASKMVQQNNFWKNCNWQGPKILVCDDVHRGMIIPGLEDKKALHLPVHNGSNDPCKTILHYSEAFEEADEIHCYDSGPYHFADSLNLRGDLFYYKDVKPYLGPFNDYKTKNNWKIVKGNEYSVYGHKEIMSGIKPKASDSPFQKVPVGRESFAMQVTSDILSYEYGDELVTLPLVVADCGFTENFPWNDFYFHWMVQLLPMFRLLKESGAHYDKIVCRAHLPWQKRTLSSVLKNLGISEDVIIPSGDFIPKKKIWPGMHGGYIPPFPFPQKLVDWLSEIFLVDRESKFPKQVYITRRKAFLRRVVNEEDLIAATDLPVFELDGMSPEDQANLFHGADLIVGPHGGGFTNLLYCRPGIRVIEIDVDDDVCNHIKLFQDMSYDFGLNYTFFKAECANTEERWANYKVDLEKFREVLNVNME